MKCYDCNGKGGWGHTAHETDLYGRTVLRKSKDRFYPCSTCHGSGNVTQDVYNQSKKQADERFDALDRELGEEAEQFARELDLERAIEYNNRYNQ
jgi:hypothetical protein